MSRSRPHGGHARADRDDAVLAFGVREGEIRNGHAHSLGQLLGAARLRVGKNCDDLFAAVAGHEVTGAIGGSLQHLTDGA